MNYFKVRIISYSYLFERALRTGLHHRILFVSKIHTMILITFRQFIVRTCIPNKAAICHIPHKVTVYSLGALGFGTMS
jgi:hypothetical protein